MLSVRPGEALPPGCRFVGAIGNFDGVHPGHRYLLERLLTAAAARGDASLVITFEPHPRSVLRPADWPGALATAAEREALLVALGLDAVLTLPFTTDLAVMTPQEFFALLTSTVSLTELWVGEDFRFGHRRSGDVDLLRRLAGERGIEVRSVARRHGAAGVFSSSTIRTLLRDGRVADASALLGRPYRLGGIVVAGDRRGRELGYPTANLAPDRGKVIPGRGVYAADAHVEGRTFASAVSIGVRPQFAGEDERVEAYLLDFEGDLYGRRLELAFRSRLRDERRFPDVDALVEQIGRDVAAVRRLAE